MWRLSPETQQFLAIGLLAIAVALLILLCVLTALFCKKRRQPWANTTIMSRAERSCYNDGFEYADELCPRRIEERRSARLSALRCEDPKGDLTLTRMDRSVGHALAVEQLLRDSYVFDTRVLAKPEPDVRVIAAKRDYL